jgi:NAD-dependent dihydropyrimidine dehydrogenase PreA subunit
MTYVIGQPCVDIKDRACVDECPVDCIYEGARMLYILHRRRFGQHAIVPTERLNDRTSPPTQEINIRMGQAFSTDHIDHNWAISGVPEIVQYVSASASLHRCGHHERLCQYPPNSGIEVRQHQSGQLQARLIDDVIAHRGRPPRA